MNNEYHGFEKAMMYGGVLLLLVGIVVVGKWLLFPRSLFSYATSGSGSAAVSAAVVKGDVQEVAIDLQPGTYAAIVVKKGIPVKFNIRAKKENINSYNGNVVIPEYNVRTALKPGDNIIAFTPDKAGTIPYTCWMGMMSSSIQMVDDISKADLTAVPVPVGGGMASCKPQ